MDDDRVEGCREGVVLRDDLPKVDVLLCSRTLRDSEGKVRSTLCETLRSTERLLFAAAPWSGNS